MYKLLFEALKILNYLFCKNMYPCLKNLGFVTCICVPGVRETRGVGLTILAAALGIPGPTVARGEGRAGFSATWLATPT